MNEPTRDEIHVGITSNKFDVFRALAEGKVSMDRAAAHCKALWENDGVCLPPDDIKEVKALVGSITSGSRTVSGYIKRFEEIANLRYGEKTRARK